MKDSDKALYKSIDNRVKAIQNGNADIDELIKEYIPFIKNIASQSTGTYVNADSETNVCCYARIQRGDYII